MSTVIYTSDRKSYGSLIWLGWTGLGHKPELFGLLQFIISKYMFIYKYIPNLLLTQTNKQIKKQADEQIQC